MLPTSKIRFNIFLIDNSSHLLFVVRPFKVEKYLQSEGILSGLLSKKQVIFGRCTKVNNFFMQIFS